MLYYWKKAIVDNYVNFSGRASRSEYWYFVLLNFIISMVFNIITFVLASNGVSDGLTVVQVLSWLVSLALFLPGLGVSVRRLHDIGKSGWWLFIILIPCCIGLIWLVILMCTGSEMNENEYGPVPED